MKDNPFFRILEFAANRKEYFNIDDFCEILGQQEESADFYNYILRMSSLKADMGPHTFLLAVYKYNKFSIPIRFPDLKSDDEILNEHLTYVGLEFIITPVGMATYLEMLELHESRKAAKQAKNISWFAIIVTLLIGVGQLFLASLQTTDTLIISFIRSLFQ